MNIKKTFYVFTLVAIALFCTGCESEDVDNSQVINIPDPVFRNYCLETYDKNKNGEVSEKEVYKIKEVDVSGKLEIKSLKGIEYFTSLKKLHCEGNDLQELDLSKNIELTYLNCTYNISLQPTIDVSKNIKLQELYCYYTGISTLDVSNNTQLKVLACYYCIKLKEVWLGIDQNIDELKVGEEYTIIKRK